MPLNTEPYSGWGRVLTARAERARPEKSSALHRFMADTPGPAIGNLRAYGDAALTEGRPAAVMTRLDRFLAFDAKSGVLEAEAGVTLSEILHVFGPKGWIPAVMPGTGFATLGGTIAADVHGKNHHAEGSFGQHVKSLRLLGADGHAKTVSPRDETLFRATVGGMGLTGAIESARIQLSPCPQRLVDVTERRVPDLKAYMEAYEASDATFSVGWIDATARGGTLGRGILEEAEFTTREAAYVKRPRKPSPVPLTAPGFTLASPVVRLFNTLYYRRIPTAGRTRSRPLAAFFHPLDQLLGWNKLYGKAGFHQFQCVIPHDAAGETLEAMLREIAQSGLAAPLAVLKKMGGGRAGMMSFPMEGYTLAVDFPNRQKAAPLIRRLIDRTAEAGGRIYMAKDSLAEPRHIEKMYPELEAFRAAVHAADPDGVFETDLARRLNLRGAA